MTTRLLAALCMFSAMGAVLRFDSATTTGRMIIVPSIMVAVIGQLFASQASKPEPGTWVLALLPLFWVGLIAVGVLWLVALA